MPPLNAHEIDNSYTQLYGKITHIMALQFFQSRVVLVLSTYIMKGFSWGADIFFKFVSVSKVADMR